MIDGSVNVDQSTSGSKTRGMAPAVWTRLSKSVLTVSRISRLQQAHRVWISTSKDSCRKRPCTKGVAIASSAQAPWSRSPVLKTRRCGVSAAVTG